MLPPILQIIFYALYEHFSSSFHFLDRVFFNFIYTYNLFVIVYHRDDNVQNRTGFRCNFILVNLGTTEGSFDSV